MKKRFLLIAAMAAMLMCGCTSTQNNGENAEEAVEPQTEQTLVGADEDAHGCKGTAGFVWSELLQKCVRPWEAGIKVKATEAEESTYEKAYHMVISEDGTAAELLGIGMLTPTGNPNEWTTADGSITVTAEVVE